MNIERLPNPKYRCGPAVALSCVSKIQDAFRFLGLPYPDDLVTRFLNPEVELIPKGMPSDAAQIFGFDAGSGIRILVVAVAGQAEFWCLHEHGDKFMDELMGQKVQWKEQKVVSFTVVLDKSVVGQEVHSMHLLIQDGWEDTWWENCAHVVLTRMAAVVHAHSSELLN